MNRMLRAKEVSEILQIGETKAYQIIRQLNEELARKGYLTVRGRISETYFLQRSLYIWEGSYCSGLW